MSKPGGLRGWLPWVAALMALGTGSEAALAGPALPRAQLVERGRQVFTGETFGGNGRTCATCHRPDNNYTIDPAYIARLPASDPLFVAERVPALRTLERPQLLRRLGLVTVNVDGFGRPAVARAVPHLFDLRRTTAVEPGRLTLPGGRRDLAAALGWSGDGAPGGGTLREFVAGAVVQHLPRTLARVPGADFRPPTAAELDALEAFLLSLGDRERFDLSDATGLRFAEGAVERGRVLFNGEASGPCASCHADGGALDGEGFNTTTDIGVQRRPNPLAAMIDPGVPGDGGFGASPATAVAGRAAHGDGRFNAPSLVHAADTAPLFHDHSSNSMEAAVAFYISPSFRASPEGRTRTQVAALREPELAAIAALLRTLNAMENISASNAMLQEASTRDLARGREMVGLAAADTEDAVEVLTRGVSLYRGPVGLLRQALALERRAQQATTTTSRNGLVREATRLKATAREAMAD